MSKAGIGQDGDAIGEDEVQSDGAEAGVQSGEQAGGPEASVGKQKPPRKRRASSNFALERWLESKEREGGGPSEPNLWEQIRDGFISPEEAIGHISKAKLTGTFRAVRVASEEHVSELMTPEPVLTVKKVKKQRA